MFKTQGYTSTRVKNFHLRPTNRLAIIHPLQTDRQTTAKNGQTIGPTS